MDGKKLFEFVSKRDDALARRIIFVSGDTVSPDTQAFFQSTGTRWLSKPFTKAQVLEKVNEMPEEQPALT
jgi:two-component system NtrC family sensor kinase